MMAFAGAAVTHAGQVAFDSASQFNAQGVIAYDTNFDSFGTRSSSPGNPYTAGDVTYDSGANVIIGTQTQAQHTGVANVITSNDWTPVPGVVNPTPQYNLFGFDMATLGNSGPITITVDTNQGSYQYIESNVPSILDSLEFFGVEDTTPGEYITGFSLATQGPEYGVGITNVEVGHVAAVPDSSPTLVLMLGALLGVAGLNRRLKTA